MAGVQASDMARRYQSVAQRSRSISDRAEEDQNRVMQLEGDLDQSLAALADPAERLHRQRFRPKGIQNVLDVANREYNNLKRQYVQGSNLTSISNRGWSCSCARSTAPRSPSITPRESISTEKYGPGVAGF